MKVKGISEEGGLEWKGGWEREGALLATEGRTRSRGWGVLMNGRGRVGMG